MRELYQKRLAKYQKELLKYSKYIVNDHFSIVLLFLVGALSYYYLQVLELVKVGNLFAKLAIIFVLLLAFYIGRLKLLSEQADMSFLLPKEQQFSSYFKAALKASAPMPLLVNLLVILALAPLYLRATGFPLYQIIAIFCVQTLEKLVALRLQAVSFYQDTRRMWFVFYLQYLISLVLMQFISPIFVLVVVSILFVVTRRFIRLEGSLAWQQLIDNEAERKERVYRFISMFTDVPSLSSKVSRKKYLDFALKIRSFDVENTYYYLFKRAFFRNNAYFYLVLRLNGLAILAILSIQNLMIVILIAIIVLYLIGFQLIPLAHHFDTQLLTAIYPIKPTQKIKNLQQLILNVLLLSTVLLSLVAGIKFRSGMVSVMPLALTLFSLGFTQFYLPKRLKL
ncbi:MAG: ABC transporter permease [Streptococcaceae bacterium]|jgi:ABC-2 type transport system permease protein|nr:ABC transporter permease [Streptococcaceae bacterium]